MSVFAIVKDYISRYKLVFENITTKISKRFLNWLILSIRTVEWIPGKVNFTRLSRYGRWTAKTFASNFKTYMDYMKVNIGIARENFDNDDDKCDIRIVGKRVKMTYRVREAIVRRFLYKIA